MFILKTNLHTLWNFWLIIDILLWAILCVCAFVVMTQPVEEQTKKKLTKAIAWLAVIVAGLTSVLILTDHKPTIPKINKIDTTRNHLNQHPVVVAVKDKKEVRIISHVTTNVEINNNYKTTQPSTIDYRTQSDTNHILEVLNSLKEDRSSEGVVDKKKVAKYTPKHEAYTDVSALEGLAVEQGAELSFIISLIKQGSMTCKMDALRVLIDRLNVVSDKDVLRDIQKALYELTGHKFGKSFLMWNNWYKVKYG